MPLSSLSDYNQLRIENMAHGSTDENESGESENGLPILFVLHKLRKGTFPLEKGGWRLRLLIIHLRAMP